MVNSLVIFLLTFLEGDVSARCPFFPHKRCNHSTNYFRKSLIIFILLGSILKFL